MPENLGNLVDVMAGVAGVNDVLPRLRLRGRRHSGNGDALTAEHRAPSDTVPPGSDR